MEPRPSTCPACGSEVTIDLGGGVCARCSQTTASAAVPSDDFVVPEQLGSVRLGERIGRGAAGVVCRGFDQVLGRAVAVKFLVGLAGSGREGLFLDEARAAAAVRHPNLVQIFQATVAGNVPCLVLEYVSGVTLSKIVRECGALSPAAMLAVMSEAAAAVAALHENGILHRDLKPSNLMLDREGHVRVTDLGLALHRPPSSGAAAPATLAGTPAYMAPEGFDGRASVRSDVYSLGITAFELLAGRVPFEGTFDELRLKHEREPLPAALLIEHGVAPAVVEVIERATHKQPPFRYKTAADLARALARAVGETNLERSRRDLSLLVARCVTGAPAAPRPDDSAPPTSYAQAMSSLALSKRQRRTIMGIGDDTPVAQADEHPDPPLAQAIAPMAAVDTTVVDAVSRHRSDLPPMQFITAQNRAAVFTSLRRSGPRPLIQIGWGLLIVVLEFVAILSGWDLAELLTRRLGPVPRRVIEIVVALFCGAAVIVVAVQLASRRLSRRLRAALRQHGLCLECGYDVSKAAGDVCPECGFPLRPKSTQ